MINFGDFFRKFKKEDGGAEKIEISGIKNNFVNSSPAIENIRNWYTERYENILVQRNLIFVLLILLLIFSIFSVITVTYLMNLRTFEPFVIQVDDSTGVAKIVNPVSSELLSANDSLSRYFIKKYVIARETYNPVDFDTYARRTVRLLSTSDVYRAYLGYIRDENVDPVIKYGQQNTTFLLVKSWSKLSDGKYVMRFSVNETEDRKKVYNKIAIISYKYVAMELTEDEREINPIGFQVIGYRVDDDNS